MVPETRARMEAAHVLRARGLTWLNCTEWFSQRGIRYSMHALVMAHMRWLRTRPELPPPTLDIESRFPLIHHPSLADLL